MTLAQTGLHKLLPRRFRLPCFRSFQHAAYYTKSAWRECGGIDPADLSGIHLREADLSAKAQCAAAETPCAKVFHFAASFFSLRVEPGASLFISANSFCEPSSNGFNALYAGGTSSDVRYVATPMGIT